jgi:hypothetical protein
LLIRFHPSCLASLEIDWHLGRTGTFKFYKCCQSWND